MIVLNNPTAYQTIRQDQNHEYVVRIEREVPNGTNVLYGMDQIVSCEIEQSLYSGDGPQIGNTMSARCNLVLIEESKNWPRMAKFRVQLSIKNESTQTGWFRIGTFYTDERSYDHGWLTISAFDGMLTLEQSWTDKLSNNNLLPNSWPITGYDAITRIASATSVTFDNANEIDDTVPFVGLDTTSTIRDVLNSVAAANGGNWQMTNIGHLRFVTTANGEAIPAIAGIAVAGISVAGVGDNSAEEIGTADKLYLGMEVNSHEFGVELEEITGVELTTAKGTSTTAGDSTGYVIHGECEFSDTGEVPGAGLADVCLNKLRGFRYKPFTATGAFLDPLAEVGDLAFILGEYYQMINIHWYLGKHITADISAPHEEEVDHEYNIERQSAKNLKKVLEKTDGLEDRVYSEIKQTAESITTTVGKVETDVSNLSSSLEQTATSFEVSLNNYSDQVRQYIRYENGVVIVGEDGSESNLRISNEEVGLYMGDEKVTYWNQNMQKTPSRLEIPFGGSLQLGDFMFQPRKSGNMSLVWVGD